MFKKTLRIFNDTPENCVLITKNLWRIATYSCERLVPAPSSDEYCIGVHLLTDRSISNKSPPAATKQYAAYETKASREQQQRGEGSDSNYIEP